MAPLVNKIHQLKNGFVQMENLDETTGLCFYLHNNKLADKPILLFPGGMVKLVRALPKAYEIYDELVLIRAKAAEAGGELPTKLFTASTLPLPKCCKSIWKFQSTKKSCTFF